MAMLLFIGVLQCLELESDVTAVPKCEKPVDNFACLKARKKHL